MVESPSTVALTKYQYRCVISIWQRYSAGILLEIKPQVNKDLWDIWFRMDLLSASKLHNELHQWYCKYADELVQGYIDPRDNRWHYSKERTLKAYLSLRSFTRYLLPTKPQNGYLIQTILLRVCLVK